MKKILILCFMLGFSGCSLSGEKQEVSFKKLKTFIKENVGKCEKANCGNLGVYVLDNSGNELKVSAIYRNLKDDSVKSEKVLLKMENNKGNFKIISIKKEYLCQKGRGSDESFSPKKCL